MTSEATPLAIEDFETIEAAVMETERGRWFLSEYARRHRQADTLAIVDKLDRIERTINRQRRVPDIDRIRLDLADMAEAITRTKQEIFQMKVEAEEGGRFAEASNELDAIVSQTEQATETILQNAEKAQELAWTLRENNVAAELCDNLESYVTEIYTGCSFQDLTGQRTRKVVTVLRYLESRINSMTGIWGLDESGAEDAAPADTVPREASGLDALERAVASVPAASSLSNPFETRPDGHLLNGPQLDGRGINQSDVDDLMDFSGSADDFVAVHASDTGQEQMRQQATPEVVAEPQQVQPAGATAKAAHAPEVRQPARTAVRGNTVLAVEPELARDPDVAPALMVVPISDPIAELSREDKLIAFG